MDTYALAFRHSGLDPESKLVIWFDLTTFAVYLTPLRADALFRLGGRNDETLMHKYPLKMTSKTAPSIPIKNYKTTFA